MRPRALSRWTPLIYAAYAAIALLALFPIAWILSMSFKAPDDLFSVPPRWIPRAPNLDNYAFILFGTQVPRLFLNSILVSGLTTLVTLAFATTSGYAFSRFSFRGKSTWLLVLLGAQLIPGVSNVVPLYVMMRSAGLLDTLYALVLIYSATFVPLSIWILKASFDRVPMALEEAAMIDGCTRFGAFWRVALPLVGPGLIAAGTMTVVNSWNEFFLALILTSSPESRTIATGMYLFQGQYGNNAWNIVAAVAVTATLVPLVLFAFFQRHMIDGLSQGAIKG